MDEEKIRIEVDPELWLFLLPGNRGRELTVTSDDTASLGHVIESVGIPLPEVGPVEVDGRRAGHEYRPRPGERIRILPVERPQAVPIDPPIFLLDVHLGTLARRLRLVGVDTAYGNDLDDDTLIEIANAERRILLTQDRGLLRRRTLWLGAHVRSQNPDDQLVDVLTRFAPPLAPWTRCTACNAPLEAVGKSEVESLLEAGTSRTYDVFARCSSCERVYWRGAHHRHLQEIVERATTVVASTAAS
ncbi:Mut7-C RNAse domain-containing protein [Thermopolyspora sp. NPDC052614]|uniref:Mut7-C RNAse domain-containing protein n=1 Tax=Thermopolyspora sp. NPDC052614 TaxID=3155682 RepID=UPI0034324F1E